MFIAMIMSVIVVIAMVITDAPVWVIVFTSMCYGSCMGLWIADMIDRRGD